MALNKSADDSDEDNTENLTFTLKDFVKIFRADKVGEKISKIIKNTCLEKKYVEQQA